VKEMHVFRGGRHFYGLGPAAGVFVCVWVVTAGAENLPSSSFEGEYTSRVLVENVVVFFFSPGKISLLHVYIYIHAYIHLLLLLLPFWLIYIPSLILLRPEQQKHRRFLLAPCGGEPSGLPFLIFPPPHPLFEELAQDIFGDSHPNNRKKSSRRRRRYCKGEKKKKKIVIAVLGDYVPIISSPSR
jgi:hypothetical protein